jgi:3-hydroxyacyl-CoA dehydrogenase/enoyl-CoA hydratase/3-hydroxybutyryl-CoA epimerase
MSDHIRYERDADGVVTLTFDAPGRSTNTLNSGFRTSFAAAVDRLERERDDITGVVLTSAKDTFVVGADLDEMNRSGPVDAAELTETLDGLKAQLRRLEKLGRPVVAAINGTALGGGWEIALSCHHRICLDDPKIQLGFPEVQLGLLPGAGGVVRTVRLLGLEQALPLLLEGKRLRPAAAEKAGLVHERAATAEEMAAKARAWIAGHADAQQPWDAAPDYQPPGMSPKDPSVAGMLAAGPAMLWKKTRGHYPAPERILAAAVESLQVDIDTAMKVETEYFVELASGQVARNMIGTFWFGLNEVNAGKSRPGTAPTYTTSKLGVLGAGMMGGGIAYVAAKAGIDVVLKDVSVSAAEKGRQYSATILDKRVGKGRMTAEERDAVLARITPTADDADLAGCDLVIEAVFEDRTVKDTVLRAADKFALPDAVIASNTSTLPITGLATSVADQSRFVGMHFFSPVERMPLLEIIRGRRSGDEALAKAFDFARQIGKTPIVVNDGRGFYTSRVFGLYVAEGAAMLSEGVPAPVIENVARRAGMPVGPLAVLDEISMTTALRIRRQTVKDLAEQGIAEEDLPGKAAFGVITAMAEELGRPGKAAGAGFYDYPADGKKRLWSGLAERWERADHGVPVADIRDRLLFTMALETVRAMEEGVVTSTADANVGSIFALGYAPASGGTLQFVNAYGVAEFVSRTEYLAERYGEQFAVPALLRDKAARGEQF